MPVIGKYYLSVNYFFFIPRDGELSTCERKVRPSLTSPGPHPLIKVVWRVATALSFGSLHPHAQSWLKNSIWLLWIQTPKGWEHSSLTTRGSHTGCLEATAGRSTLGFQFRFFTGLFGVLLQGTFSLGPQFLHLLNRPLGWDWCIWWPQLSLTGWGKATSHTRLSGL